MSVQVVLWDPKYGHNVGGAVRAAATLGADAVWWTGDRANEDFVSPKGKFRIPREERLREYQKVTHEQVPDSRVFGKHGITEGHVPVCVELAPQAESLEWFDHPEHAVYIFGPEDGGLNGFVRSMCHRHVQIPTLADSLGRDMCLNLSNAVNVVLWDRRFKQLRGDVT